jgi:hypothetical protein
MRGTTRLCLVIASGLILSACESEPAEQASQELPADTVAALPTTPLADLAGTWDMRAVPESGDTTATVFQFEVTTDGVTMMLPDRDPIELEVTTSGDSIVMDSGSYESVRREGVMTRTHTVLRLEGERLVGTTIARYETTEADSVLHLVIEGTRTP